MREIRRNLFANKESLDVTDLFDEELIEDIHLAAPELKALHITILEGNMFSSKGISALKNLEDLQIVEGTDLEQFLFPDLGELKHLKSLYINIDENTKLDEIDITNLAGNDSIESIEIECNVKSLKLDGLSSCTNLESTSLCRLDGNSIDLSPLSGCPKLESIQILAFGRDS